MKHVGKMKNNGARVAVVFRTLPGDPFNALVVGTNGLADSYHDSLMSLIETESGQTANELGEILAVRRFPDGSNMLEFMHTRGMLKKVKTDAVLMTPDPTTSIQLDELNQLIATQRGITVEELAVNEDSASSETPAKATKAEPTKNKWDKAREDKAAAKVDAEAKVEETKASAAQSFELTPSEMRSRADALFKEAQRLRKEADAQDPPKKKTTKSVEEA
jgi:hypothetical protein